MSKQSKNKSEESKKTYLRSIFGDMKKDGYQFTTAYHTMGSSKPDKTAWAISDAKAHDLFKKAYSREISHCRDGIIGEIAEKDYCWMNDDLKGFCSLSTVIDPNNGWLKLQLIGKNNEPFAFFPVIRNLTDTWHGYPVQYDKIQKRLLKYWLDKGFISDRDYRDIRRNHFQL